MDAGARVTKGEGEVEVGEGEAVGEEEEEEAEESAFPYGWGEMKHKGVGEEGKKGGVEQEIKEVEEQM